VGKKIARVFIYLATTRDNGHFGKIPKKNIHLERVCRKVEYWVIVAKC
jgi:hypothetical protein